MNYRLVAFAAIMTATLGALLGWSLTYIGQPDLEMRRYRSEFYQTLQHRYPLIGSGLGLAAGAGFAIISQTSRQRGKTNSRP